MDREQAVAAMTVLVCEQGFTEAVAREILAADCECDILRLPKVPPVFIDGHRCFIDDHR